MDQDPFTQAGIIFQGPVGGGDGSVAGGTGVGRRRNGEQRTGEGETHHAHDPGIEQQQQAQGYEADRERQNQHQIQQQHPNQPTPLTLPQRNRGGTVIDTNAQFIIPPPPPATPESMTLTSPAAAVFPHYNYSHAQTQGHHAGYGHGHTYPNYYASPAYPGSLYPHPHHPQQNQQQPSSNGHFPFYTQGYSHYASSPMASQHPPHNHHQHPPQSSYPPSPTPTRHTTPHRETPSPMTSLPLHMPFASRRHFAAFATPSPPMPGMRHTVHDRTYGDGYSNPHNASSSHATRRGPGSGSDGFRMAGGGVLAAGPTRRTSGVYDAMRPPAPLRSTDASPGRLRGNVESADQGDGVQVRKSPVPVAEDPSDVCSSAADADPTSTPLVGACVEGADVSKGTASMPIAREDDHTAVEESSMAMAHPASRPASTLPTRPNSAHGHPLSDASPDKTSALTLTNRRRKPWALRRFCGCPLRILLTVMFSLCLLVALLVIVMILPMAETGGKAPTRPSPSVPPSSPRTAQTPDVNANTSQATGSPFGDAMHASSPTTSPLQNVFKGWESDASPKRSQGANSATTPSTRKSRRKAVYPKRVKGGPSESTGTTGQRDDNHVQQRLFSSKLGSSHSTDSTAPLTDASVPDDVSFFTHPPQSLGWNNVTQPSQPQSPMPSSTPAGTVPPTLHLSAPQATMDGGYRPLFNSHPPYAPQYMNDNTQYVEGMAHPPYPYSPYQAHTNAPGYTSPTAQSRPMMMNAATAAAAGPPYATHGAMTMGLATVLSSLHADPAAGPPAASDHQQSIGDDGVIGGSTSVLSSLHADAATGPPAASDHQQSTVDDDKIGDSTSVSSNLHADSGAGMPGASSSTSFHEDMIDDHSTEADLQNFRMRKWWASLPDYPNQQMSNKSIMLRKMENISLNQEDKTLKGRRGETDLHSYPAPPTLDSSIGEAGKDRSFDRIEQEKPSPGCPSIPKEIVFQEWRRSGHRPRSPSPTSPPSIVRLQLEFET